jgi:16S rRNA (guanine527-N7)-methyltransferase
MRAARIAELLEPFLAPSSANAALYQDISMYVDILLRWNARINLTAIRNPEEIVTRHFGESLFAATHLFPSTARVGTGDSPVRLADLGSGAGFPGLPIKLWASNLALTLIESNHKKAAFLSEVTRALTLTDVNIQNVRAETLPPTTFEVVTLRAVERFVGVLPVAARLVTRSGRLALLIASSQLDAARSTLPTFSWDPPLPIPHSKSRLLLVGGPNQEYKQVELNSHFIHFLEWLMDRVVASTEVKWETNARLSRFIKSKSRFRPNSLPVFPPEQLTKCSSRDTGCSHR